jgi:hypothetical protein
LDPQYGLFENESDIENISALKFMPCSETSHLLEIEARMKSSDLKNSSLQEQYNVMKHGRICVDQEKLEIFKKQGQTRRIKIDYFKQ